MKRRPQSSVIASAYKQAIKHLKDEAPDAARVLDAIPAASVRSDTRPVVANAPEPASAPSALSSVMTQRGRVFQASELELPVFREGLMRACQAQGLDPFDLVALRSLGVENFAEFVEMTKRALTVDSGTSVTPSKASGNYFEIVGWTHPAVLMTRRKIMAEYMASVHAIASTGKGLRDGLYQPVVLKSRFNGPIITIENPRLVSAMTGSALDGGQWVDRIDYVLNSHEQILAVFGELKTAAAARNLKTQVTARDPRLLATLALTDAKPVVEGKVGGRMQKLSPNAFIFPENVNLSALNRIGVRASAKATTRYSVKISEDAYKESYVKITLYCRTSMLWRIYSGLYKEMSW